MIERVVRQIGLCIFAAGLCAVTVLGQSSSPAIVAIASGSELSLYAASGEIVQRIDLKHPVAGFALSPDRSKLVIVSPDTEHGGALILVDLKTGSRRKLTAGPFVFRRLNPGETEVYDSPAFSPDGHHLVFAVHRNQPGDGNDADENSGPFAMLDLDTGRTRVLKATNNIDGTGPCSEWDPHWSPDGKWILFNCETGAFLTDLAGTVLRDLKIDPHDGDSSAAAWVGGSCVLYEQTPENDRNAQRYLLLNLETGKSLDAIAVLPFSKEDLIGLMEVSGDAVVARPGGNVEVKVPGKSWVLPAPENGSSFSSSSAQVLSGWRETRIPEECRPAYAPSSSRPAAR